MNPHEECLGRAQGYFEGSLDLGGRAAFEAHRAGCPDCRAVLARWQAEVPLPRLVPAVLAKLKAGSVDADVRVEARPLRSGGWMLALASVLALALVVTAFWHPERQWARDDGSVFVRPSSPVPVLRGAPWLAD